MICKQIFFLFLAVFLQVKVPAIISGKTLLKRWILEKTFAWLYNWRCLFTEVERKTASSDTFIHQHRDVSFSSDTKKIKFKAS